MLLSLLSTYSFIYFKKSCLISSIATIFFILEDLEQHNLLNFLIIFFVDFVFIKLIENTNKKYMKILKWYKLEYYIHRFVYK